MSRDRHNSRDRRDPIDADSRADRVYDPVTCDAPEWVICDGTRHFRALFDGEVGRWVHLADDCPHAGANRRTRNRLGMQ